MVIAPPSPSASPRLLLFGSCELHGGQVVALVPERRYQLLAILGLHAGEAVPRERLAALFWPDRSPGEARRNLRKVIHDARAVPGASGIQATEHALRWDVDCDLHEFREAVRRGQWSQALGLRRAPALSGLDGGEPGALSDRLNAERERLEQAWQAAAMQQLRGLSDPAQRAALARVLLEADPCDESAAEALIDALLQSGQQGEALAAYRHYARGLADRLGIEPAKALRDRIAAIGPTPPPVARSAPTADGGTFVGRRTELSDLAGLLADPACRALTLLGPGGTGKSRLARHALGIDAQGLASGWHWIELEDVADVGGVVTRLSQRLDIVPGSATDPVQALLSRLGAGSWRLVLDNAEHLADLPALLQRLLDGAPGLRLLITSRVRLHLRDEWVLPLAGLAVPDEDSRDPCAAASFDAVRLFDLRARAARRDFDLAREIDDVIAIVDAVAGMPLAIELAAGWVRLLPVEAIARDLAQAVDVLERDPAAAGAPMRTEHASMRAVLDRTWDLLAPREREALEALSVFQGGFSHAAAREVARVALPVLSSLVDKSVLRVDDSGRFGMHPLIAADAAARAAPDMRAAGRDRHASYFARQLEELATTHPGDHRPLVRALRDEWANCESAWRHAVAARRCDLVHAMVPAWRRYIVATGRFEEGGRTLERVLTLEGEPGASAVVAHCRAALAWFAKCIGDADRAVALATDVLAAAEQAPDPGLTVDAINTIGAARLLQGHWAEAQRWFERSARECSAHGLRREAASALNNLGLARMCTGQLDGCSEDFARAHAIQSELGDHVSAARALHNLASVEMARGDWERARVENERALRYARAHEAEAIAMPVEFMLGATLIELGRLEAAERHLRSVRERCRLTAQTDYELKAEYYLARCKARREGGREGVSALLRCARTAQQQDSRYDQLYIALFVAEYLRDTGQADDAARLVRAVQGAPQADAFVRAVIRAIGVAPAESLPAADFDWIAEQLAACDDIAQLRARLHPARA